MGRVRHSPVAPPASPVHVAGASLAEFGRTIWRRDFWFLLGIVWLIVVSVLALTAGSNALTAASTAPTASGTPAAGQPTATPASSATASVLPARERIYTISGPVPGLMQPAVDEHGNVWFGEMDTNRLGRLDPSTGAVSSWEPPNGRFGIMQTATDAHGDIWFTEQAANYIGRFDPASQTFRTYPLATVNGHTSSPQDLAFDASGILWFTEVGVGRLGRLDPATGAVSTWDVPVPAAGIRAYPYSLAPSPDGTVWFGYLSGGAIGRFDPSSQQFTLYHVKNTQAQLFAMALDSAGRLWFTELEQDAIGVLDTHTGSIEELPVPQNVGGAGGLYDITITSDGNVWFACTSANALVRYQPDKRAFTFFQLSTPNSIPYGLARDNKGQLWFTADDISQNYVGMVQPPAA
jgi:virginiamycin B lyase